MTLIGLVPTLRARKFRVPMWTLAFACFGFASETWLQAHYVAVASGIVYLILLNGLRWMHVSARHHVVWLELLRGTLASIVCMFCVRLVVVPRNTFPPNWASQTADTRLSRYCSHHGGESRQATGHRSLSSRSFFGDIAGSTTVTILRAST
jgi:hypothetical protein